MRMPTGVSREAPRDLGASLLCELLSSTEALRAAHAPPVPCLRVGTPPVPLPACGDPAAPPPACGDVVARACHISIRASSWGLACRGDPVSRAILPSFSSVVSWEPRGCKAGSSAGDGSSTPAVRLASGTWWAQALSPVQSFATPWTVATSSSVHGLLQASILGWAAISCFRGLGRGAHSQALSERREGSVSAAVTVSPHRRRPRQWGSSATPGLGSPAHQPGRPFPVEPEGPLSWALELPGRPRARLHSAALSLTLSPSFWGPGYGGGLISAILGGLGSLAQRS